MLLSKQIQEQLLQVKEGVVWNSSFFDENPNFFITEVKKNLSELMIEDSICGRVTFVGYLDHKDKKIKMANEALTLEPGGPITIESYSKDVIRCIFRKAAIYMMDTLLNEDSSVDADEFLNINCLTHAINTNSDYPVNLVKAEAYLIDQPKELTLQEFLINILDGNEPKGLNTAAYLFTAKKFLQSINIPYHLFTTYYFSQGNRTEEAIAEHQLFNALIEEDMPAYLYKLSSSWTNGRKNLSHVSDKAIELFHEIRKELDSWDAPRIVVQFKNGDRKEDNAFYFLKYFSPAHYFCQSNQIIYNLNDIASIKIQKKEFKLEGI